MRISTIAAFLLGFSFANPTIADTPLTADKAPMGQIAQKYAINPNEPEANPAYVEQRVREYFRDIPEMIAIAECESTFRQYESDGRLLVNSNPKSSASGVFQILYITHYDDWARSKKTHITTLEGNLAFARQLYKRYGNKPWKASRHCWRQQMASK